jgi:LacI family transcriptional regulator
LAVTLKDIARELGVSIVTVSRAVHGRPDVSPETRKAVLELAARLRYRPNSVARSLVTKRSNVWGLIVPDLMHSFFVEISQGVESVAGRHNIHLIIVNSHEDVEKERSEILALIERQVDGLIVASCQPSFGESNLEVLEDEHVPFVLVDRYLGERPWNYVLCDNERVGYLATEHLIKLGHQAIAHVYCPGLQISGMRLAGYRRALKDHGIKIQPILEQPGGVTQEAGYQATKSLLGLNQRPTAVFAFNDPMAIGVMEAAFDAGLSVPADVAVVGAGNIAHGNMLKVALTTVEQRPFESGQRAAEVLLGAIGSDTESEPATLIMEPQLVVRESCGARSGEARRGESS